MKLHALHKIVLGSLYHLQTATLQGVIEIDRGCLAADERNCLGLLRLITVNGLLRDGIGCREQALHGEVAVGIGLYGLIKAVAFDMERDACHNAILGSLFEGNRTCGRFHIDIRLYAVGIFHACHQVLQIRVAISDEPCAVADSRHAVSGCCDTDRAAYRLFGTDSQLVSVL